jgi:hypothetical protein
LQLVLSNDTLYLTKVYPFSAGMLAYFEVMEIAAVAHLSGSVGGTPGDSIRSGVKHAGGTVEV